MEANTTETKGKNSFQKANLKAKKLREFYAHLRTYVIVNSLFFIIDWISSPEEWWVLYPIIGWGFCLTIQAIDTLIPFKDFDDKWEEKKTKELVEKYNERKH